MRIRLPSKWKNKLADLPETSMGAQHVDILLPGKRILRDVPVFNGEDCETSEPFNPRDIVDIKLHKE